MQADKLSEIVIGCCFEIMRELGSGFLESVYKNALQILLLERGLRVSVDKRFNVLFRGNCVSVFIPDLIIEDNLIVELKCCEQLVGEHQAQLINYLKLTDMRTGLLVNFGKKKIECKRVYHPAFYSDHEQTSVC
jgi:GxxExxY protein